MVDNCFRFSGVKERIRVQVFDENSRMAVYALENAKTTLTCYVEGKIYLLNLDRRSNVLPYIFL